MNLKAHTKDPSTMLRAGLVFLIAASLTKWMLERGSAPTSNGADFGMGVLYGLAIACLLTSVVLNRRGRSER